MVRRNNGWTALAGAWKIFSMEGPVWGTLRRATAALEAAEIPYAVVGGLAVFLHGHRRMTTDVDILVRPADKARVRAALKETGMRYRKGEFIGDEDVRLHLLIAGEPEGLDWAKQIEFPDPGESQTTSTIEGFTAVRLARLVEMKLACGLSNPRRAQDVADVLKLIDLHDLDKRFAAKLHRSLRADFKRLVDITRRYPP